MDIYKVFSLLLPSKLSAALSYASQQQSQTKSSTFSYSERFFFMQYLNLGQVKEAQNKQKNTVISVLSTALVSPNDIEITI